MQNPPAAFASLDDLVDLGHTDGIDMRPTLLRVLTDLYLQRPTHTLEDERYFTELALRLIDATDVSARAALAARLATYPSAPRAVVERLARDVIEVAAPLLTQSSALTPADLAAIAKDFGSAHANVIAARSAAASTPARSRSARQVSLAAAEACELSELFYAAAPSERRLILVNLEYSTITPALPFCGLQRSDIWRLESAALQHRTETVTRELVQPLGVTRPQARRIVNDGSGEPIVVAAKALNIPADVLQRMLLFMNPAVGQSVDRAYRLAELYHEMSVDAARRMTAIWRAAEPPEAKPMPHESVGWRTAAENARRALSEVSRRPELQHDMRPRTRMEH
jgi:Uncharacterised protein conserved in bacteria (DUF2336)